MAKQPILSTSKQISGTTRLTLDELIANTNKEHGAGTLVRATEMIAKPKRISTGSLWFDLALGGGWPINAWSEIVANESAGKTALALKTIAAAQERNSEFTALWCAAEAFDLDYAIAIGVDPKRLVILEENTMEIVYDQVLKYVYNRAVDMAVIDAYPSLVTDAEAQAFVGDAQVSPGARLTGKFMRIGTKASKRSLIDASDRPFTGLFINQWREKIGVMFGDPRTTPGGKAKNFWMAARVTLAREDWIKDSEGFQVGQTIKLDVIKNKSAKPRLQGLCDFYFDDTDTHSMGEFDTAKEVFKLSDGLGIIKLEGRSWVMDGEKIATSKGQLETRIRSEIDLQNDLIARIRNQELGEKLPEVLAPTPIRVPRRSRPGSTKAA